MDMYRCNVEQRSRLDRAAETNSPGIWKGVPAVSGPGLRLGGLHEGVNQLFELRYLG